MTMNRLLPIERRFFVGCNYWASDAGTESLFYSALGISRSYVSRIEKRALMKLYHEFYKVKR